MRQEQELFSRRCNGDGICQQILEPNAVYWNLDLAPDGKRFVVSPRPEATGGQKGSVHVTVLLNFFDELRRKMPVGK